MGWLLRRLAGLLGAVLPALTFPAWAGEDELDALRLADQLPEEVAAAREWRAFVEAGLGQGQRRSEGHWRNAQRLSFDLQVDHALSPDWRLVFANRLDVSSPAQALSAPAIHTVKEAYLAGRLDGNTLLDAGRINVRYGVALAWNPTDFFRAGALRSVVSIDPASLKENRQGSVMLRGQRLWDSGSLTVMASPHLADERRNEGFNLDWGATNRRDRLLAVLSQKLSESLTPQFLLYREAGRPAQFGLNLTALAGQATVVHVEWAGGRDAAHLDQALQRPSANAWRNRLASGFTYTTDNKLSLSAEAHYDGAAPDRRDWRALRHGALRPYGLYRYWVQDAQELPTRRALFLRAFWQDALMPRLDLSALFNADLVDHSRRVWLEARYRAERIDYALQWQRNLGTGLSNYGALPEGGRWQASVRFYF